MKPWQPLDALAAFGQNQRLTKWRKAKIAKGCQASGVAAFGRTTRKKPAAKPTKSDFAGGWQWVIFDQQGPPEGT